jgi:hypothetical protein
VKKFHGYKTCPLWIALCFLLREPRGNRAMKKKIGQRFFEDALLALRSISQKWEILPTLSLLAIIALLLMAPKDVDWSINFAFSASSSQQH